MHFLYTIKSQKYLILISIIYSLPFINFINNNFHEVNIILGLSFYVLIFLFALLLLIPIIKANPIPCELLVKLDNDLSLAKSDELYKVFENNPTAAFRSWKFTFECPFTIRTNTDVLEGISTALERGVKEIPDVLNHSNIPEIVEYTVSHIFRGHGSNGGRHHISAIIGDDTRKLADRLKENAEGFYEAVFSNGKKKSFWPDTWDEFKVVDEIEHAFGNKVYKPELSPNTWEGTTTGGQKIRMFIKESDGSIISAFPILD